MPAMPFRAHRADPIPACRAVLILADGEIPAGYSYPSRDGRNVELPYRGGPIV